MVRSLKMTIFVAIVMYSMKSSLKSYLALMVALLGYAVVQAQLVVNTASPSKQYVTGLAAPGVTISNVNITGCDTTAGTSAPFVSQIGGFNATGVTNFSGITTGLILGTGSVAEADYAGGFAGGGQQLGGPGIPLLDPLVTPDTTTDGCIVTFDLTATCDTVFFKYAFASEEYDWVLGGGGDQNDVCGIFISGPTIPTPNTNIATIPGTGQHICIDNINPTTNNAYFVNNTLTAAPQLAYSGYTVGLVAEAVVTPGLTYNIKMAIADVNPQDYDAALFVEKGSCSYTPPPPPPPVLRPSLVVRTPEGAVEGCRNARAVILRGSDPDTLELTIAYGGTASILNDYTLGDPNLIGPILTMLPGTDSIVIDLLPINDGTIEALENIVINIQYDSLGVVSGKVVSIKLIDAVKVFAGPDATVCAGQSLILGDPPVSSKYKFQWSTALNPSGLSSLTVPQPTLLLNPAQTITTSYNVVATDTTTGCTASDNVIVKVVVAPKFTISMGDTILCENELTFAAYVGPSDPTYQYTWNFGAFSSSPVVNQQITTVSWSTAGLYSVTLQVAVDGCASTAAQKVLVRPTPAVSILNSGNACPNIQVQLNYGFPANAGNTYLWDFDGGNASSNTVSNPIVSWSTPGSKEISLQVVANGCSSAVALDTVTIYPIPVADFTLPQTICLKDTVLLTYTGDIYAGSSYNWNFGGGLTAPAGLPNTQPGPYSVYWTTPGVKNVLINVQANCPGTPKVRTITVLPLPEAQISPVASQCIEGNQFFFTPVNSSGMTSYSWSFGPDALPFNSTLEFPAPVSYSIPGVKHVVFQVTKDGCRSVPDTATFEVYPMPSADFVINGGLGTGIVCPGTGITVAYNGVSVHPNQVYQWTFQDGIPTGTTDQTPAPVTFISGGSKSISLIVDYKGCTDTMTQLVQVNPILTVDAGLDAEFCEGDGGVAVDASVAGGSPGYSYVWGSSIPVSNWGISNIHAEDPIMNPTIQPLAATGDVLVGYNFHVVDTNGCVSNFDTMFVRVKAKPLVNAGGDQAMCTGGPGVVLNGSAAVNNIAPNLTFSWTPSTGMLNPNTQLPYTRPTQTTVYTLVGTSSNGCSSDATTLDTLSTATVLVRPTPLVNAGPDVALCSGESIKLDAKVSGAGPSYFYVWTASPGNAVVTPASGPSTSILQPTFTAVKGVTGTTKLMLSATSNGCMSSDSLIVTVHPVPTATITGDKNICYADTITNLKVDTDLPCTYEWFNLGAAAILSDITSATPTGIPGSEHDPAGPGHHSFRLLFCNLPCNCGRAYRCCRNFAGRYDRL